MNQVSTPIKGRIIALDLLRGYFLWVILIDHVSRFPAIFEVFTGQGLLWASAADGFFLESGILVGFLRGKEVQAENFKLAWKRLWSRALVLYGWSVGLTLLFTLLAIWLPGQPGIKPGAATDISAWQLIWRSLTFQYSYGWTDFLPYYTLYMVVAPFALWLMSKKQAWLVILASVGVWFLRGHNPFLAWQVLFFIGLTGGYYFANWQKFWDSLPRLTQRWVCWSGSIIAVGILIINLWIKHLYGYQGGWLTTWFDKWSVAPGQLVVSLIWFAVLYLVVRSFESVLARRLGWLLLPVGRNSLATYIFQSFIVLGMNLLLPYPSTNLAINFSINLVAIAIVWTFAYFYDRWRTTKRFKPVTLIGS